jgi:acetyltransferase-like isoleucine patch superfamily enzyme
VKVALKAGLNLFAAALILPAVLAYRLGALALGPEKAFAGWSQAFSQLPGLSGAYLRRAFYRLVLPRCGADCFVGFGTVVSHPTAALGRKVYVGPFCCLGDVTLEDDVLLGSNVSVINGGGQHGIERLDVPVREQPGRWQRVTVGRDSWVGDRSVVLADVGCHCVIGAGSVVTKPIPSYAIAVGVPARVVRFRQGAQGPGGKDSTSSAAARPQAGAESSRHHLSQTEGA